MKNIKLSIRHLFLSIIAGLLMTAVCPAQMADSDNNIAAKLDEYVAELNKSGPFSGAILLAREGRILATKGYGMADLEHGIPNTPQTKFRLASVTKQFTAVGVMILQERNKLNVQDYVCQYLADCPESWRAITLHQLLTHTSGIPNITSLPEYKDISTLPTMPDRIIQRLKDKPLDFAPGTKFNYSNSGYIILGRVIERVAGKSYEDFMKENIFEPLRMSNTGYDHQQSILKNRALGYRWRGEFQNAPYIDMSIPFAAGGLYSTIEDMFLWDQALYTDQLISKKSIEQLFTPVRENYGYGWIIGKQFDRQNATHSGGIEGFKTVVSRFPDDKVYVVVLSNIENIGLGGMAHDLAAIALGEKYDLPQPPLPKQQAQNYPAAKINSQIFDDYAGSYEFPMFVLTVTREGDRLTAQPSSGGPKAEMIPKSETEFTIREEEGSRFVFIKDADGKVIRIDAELRGKNFEGKKIK